MVSIIFNKVFIIINEIIILTNWLMNCFCLKCSSTDEKYSSNFLKKSEI